ncbi:hypothetical protein CLV63_112101 [Murinocardiopsis flavida]|uniref:Protein phosphatase 2C-like protein n=1 Tax=Murinocardiopsis flavida TaxID=645275 RepID=A0A2P8DG94_9ACTN|nr:sigma-70 family RNA polymerase sigma factor [Murinocardiopsis flavida]PSK96219.1 hypothetical protein CLV63_112101 [Murinocardiopsis flavida]
MHIASDTRPGSPRPNEDVIAVSGPVAVLLDGAGGPAELDNGCSHGTPWYVAALAAHLLSTLNTAPDTELAAALAAAIEAVARAHPGCDLTHPGTPSATVIITRLGDHALDYLVLCDSTLLIETNEGVEVRCDTRIDEVAPQQRRAMDAAPLGSPEHQQHRLAKVGAERAARNREGGFWVAAADPAAAEYALTGSVPAAEVRRYALLTDGAARWHGFGLGDWAALLDLVDRAGTAALLDAVRAAERADPHGRRLPRAKQFDDATALLVTPAPAPLRPEPTPPGQDGRGSRDLKAERRQIRADVEAIAEPARRVRLIDAHLDKVEECIRTLTAQRSALIAELAGEGWTDSAIAALLHISRPRVTQIRGNHRATPSPTS